MAAQRKRKAVLPSVSVLPGALPTLPIPSKADYNAVLRQLVADLPTVADHVVEGALWRDQLALTGSLRTFYGGKIRKAWTECVARTGAERWEYVEGSAFPQPTSLVGRFTFKTTQTPAGVGSGFLHAVVDQAGTWKVFMVLTILEDLSHSPFIDLRLSLPSLTSPSPDETLDVLIVGAGQAGLSTASYAHSLQLRYLVLERNARIGDNWRSKYTSAKLHTVKAFNHLPFGPTFTDEEPEFLPSKNLAEGYERFATKYQLHIWTKTGIEEPATWDEEQKLWTVKVAREGRQVELTARALVLAVGPGGSVPVVPPFPGRSSFKGIVMHSKDYKDCDSWSGRKVAIVGTANTAHDIAEDAEAAGCLTTLVQRNKTYVVPRDFFTTLYNSVWNEHVPYDLSDRMFFSTPVAISRLSALAYLAPLVEGHKDAYDALEAAGFNLERHGDIIDVLSVRFGGYYQDVGCSAKIAEGRIKVHQGAAAEYTEAGLRFTDGKELEADVIILATGFEVDATKTISPLVGAEIADSLDTYWGLDEEGEISGAFKPAGHEALYLVGGGTGQARYWTRFVALQIKAMVDGTPLTLYEG